MLMFGKSRRTYSFSREELLLIDKSLDLAEDSSKDAHYVGASDMPPELRIAHKLGKQRAYTRLDLGPQPRTLHKKEWQVVAGALHNLASAWQSEIEDVLEATSHPETLTPRLANLDLQAVEEQSRRIMTASFLSTIIAADLPSLKK